MLELEKRIMQFQKQAVRRFATGGHGEAQQRAVTNALLRGDRRPVKSATTIKDATHPTCT